MKIRNIMFAGTLIMLIFAGLTACQKPAPGSTEAETAGEAMAQAAEDGFKISAVYGSSLTEEELAVWNDAADDEISGLTPLTVLAEKQGDTLIRLYLCRDMMKSGLDGWIITRIGVDSSGKAADVQAVSFDIWITTYGVYDTPEIPENKGWAIKVPEDGSALIVKDMYGIFQIAARHVEKEVSYVPVALLVEQLVAGTNYKYLCTDSRGEHLYILDIYEDMNSGADITGTGYVNLDEYL